MFRPTHFVILFAAVLLCAYAAPDTSAKQDSKVKRHLAPLTREYWRVTNGLFIPCFPEDSPNYILGSDNSVLIRSTNGFGGIDYYPLGIDGRITRWLVDDSILLRDYSLGLNGIPIGWNVNPSGEILNFPSGLHGRTIGWVVDEYNQLVPRIFYPEPTTVIL